MMTDELIWNELSFEVVSAARSEITVQDFQLQCRLAPIENGKSFFDLIRVAENLIKTNVIFVDEGYLKLSNKVIPSSLISELKIGSIQAWKILDCISPPANLLQKINLDLLSRIGLEGELSVIDELKKNLSGIDPKRIKHISLIDDSAGFDILTPSLKNVENNLLLEVKTSIRPGNIFTFYISRNEARVARQNDNWVLIGVESTPLGFTIIGNLSFNMFSEYLPINMSENGQWESAKIHIPKDYFVKGIP